MATSGSTDLTLTSRQIIAHALSLLQVTASGETPSAADAATGLQSLELMLKSWGAVPHLWLETEGSLVLTTGTASYTLPDDVDTVSSVRRRTTSIDTPLIEYSRQEYFDLPTKSAQGTPVSWYVDKQRTTMVLYVWPTASASVAANTTLEYTYQRIIQDVDDLDNEADMPQEWLETIAYGLARRLGPIFGLAGNPNFQVVASEADRLLAELSAVDQETASLFMQPTSRWSR